MHSPNWKSSALFVTWDEHGGFYDHVNPPHACPPDDYPPVQYVDKVLTNMPGAFDHYGPRVPLFVVSPYAKRGFVSHRVTDHTSILRFVETRFNLPALTNRDANADPLFDVFDFDHPDFSIPTLKEAMGIDFTTGAWRGFAGPKGLPTDIATKLTASLKKIYDSKEYKDFMGSRGFGTVWADAKEYGAFMDKSDAQMGTAMKAAGIAKT